MLTKSFPVKIKAAGEPDGLPDGQFEAIVSVFGNVDSYGDVVMPGAFQKTLERWAESGNPIPVYYSHRMDDPDFNIGHVLEAAELEPGDDRLPAGLKDLGGLWVKAELDIVDPVPGSRATQVHRLLKGRRVTQFSFAYDVIDGGFEQKDGNEIFALRELDLYEVGPTPIGANQETELLAVKSLAEATVRGIKAGRTLSAKNENLIRTAHESLGAVLEVLDDQDEKSADNRPAKDEEPAEAKSEEPSGGSVDDLLVAIAIHEKEYMS